jgi:type IV pilus assembly protein PilA
MSRKLHRRLEDQTGFSLVELLVVILILGTLAMIAIPLFLNQTAKANDASAKAQLNTAATAMQSCAGQNDGSYASCTLAQIQADEPSLSDTHYATLSATGQSQTGYTLSSSVVATGDVFTLAENNGVERRTCTAAHAAPANAGCDSSTW